MASEMTTSCAMFVALGAFHGINPGMGWLFAAALGMQERRRAGHRSCGPYRLVALATGRSSGLARRPAVFSSPAPALGRHACEHARTHVVVIPDGHGPRCRAHGGAGVRAH